MPDEILSADAEFAAEVAAQLELPEPVASGNEPTQIPVPDSTAEVGDKTPPATPKPAKAEKPAEPVAEDSPTGDDEYRAPWERQPEAVEDEGEEDEAPPSPGSTELLAKFREKFKTDLSSKYRDDDALIEGLFHAQQRLSQRDELAAFGQALQQNPQAVYAALHERFGKPAAPATPESPAPGGAAEALKKLYGDYDPSDAKKIYKDAEGNWHETEEGALKRVMAFRERMLSDPAGALKIQELVTTATQEAMQKFQQQTQQEQLAAQARWQDEQEAIQFLNASTKWMFNQGNPELGMSPAGVTFRDQYMRLAQERPHLTQRDLRDMTLLLLQQQHQQRQPRTNGKAAPRPAARGAVHRPSIRAPRVEAPDQEWPEDMEMEDFLRAETKAGRLTLEQT